MATNRVNYTQNHRTIAEVMADFREELKDFATTRIQMLRAEMTEKTKAWKAAAPAVVIGGVLLLVALLLFTGLLVAVIALAFEGKNYAYALSFGIVFVVYALAGGVALLYGLRTIRESGVAPERTMRVLKQDQVWLQTEARTQL